MLAEAVNRRQEGQFTWVTGTLTAFMPVMAGGSTKTRAALAGVCRMRFPFRSTLYKGLLAFAAEASPLSSATLWAFDTVLIALLGTACEVQPRASMRMHVHPVSIHEIKQGAVRANSRKDLRCAVQKRHFCSAAGAAWLLCQRCLVLKVPSLPSSSTSVVVSAWMTVQLVL